MLFLLVTQHNSHLRIVSGDAVYATSLLYGITPGAFDRIYMTKEFQLNGIETKRRSKILTEQSPNY